MDSTNPESNDSQPSPQENLNPEALVSQTDAYRTPEPEHAPVAESVYVEPPVSPDVKISQTISWIAIILCTTFMVGLVFLSQFISTPATTETLPPQAGIMLRMALGVDEVAGAAGNPDQYVVELNKGPITQRAGYVIGRGELENAGAARVAMEEVNDAIAEANYTPTETEQELLDATNRIINAKALKEAEEKTVSPTPDKKLQAKIDQLPAAEAVAPEQLSKDLNLVEEKLGLAGEIANAWLSDDPADLKNIRERATKSTLGLMAFVVFIGIVFFCSLIAVGVCGFFLFEGRFQNKMQAPASYSHLFLEAFAVWITIFVSAQLFFPLILLGVGFDIEGDPIVGRLATIVMFYGPMLVGIAWLLFRHPNRSQAMRDAGFTSHGIFSDIGHGVLTYLACLPGIAVAMLLTVVLTSLVWGGHEAAHPFAPDPGPSHPIQDETGGGLTTTFFLYFLAAVSAPIVEEIVFRGLLFRWLRDFSHSAFIPGTAADQRRNPILKIGAKIVGKFYNGNNSGKLNLWFSCLFAACVNSLIFASIHPQGLLGIPPLMAIGICMSLARHWREGLIAPMTVHAIHNGTLVTMLTIMNL